MCRQVSRLRLCLPTETRGDQDSWFTAIEAGPMNEVGLIPGWLAHHVRVVRPNGLSTNRARHELHIVRRDAELDAAPSQEDGPTFNSERCPAALAQPGPVRSRSPEFGCMSEHSLLDSASWSIGPERRR